MLKEKFDEFGKVERVKKIKDYAFVHFEERDEAVKVSWLLVKTTLIFSYAKTQGGKKTFSYKTLNFKLQLKLLWIKSSDYFVFAYLKFVINLYDSVLLLLFQAMGALQGKDLGGASMEISLAKPPSDKKKKEEVLRNREKRLMQMLAQRGSVSCCLNWEHEFFWCMVYGYQPIHSFLVVWFKQASCL